VVHVARRLSERADRADRAGRGDRHGVGYRLVPVVSATETKR